MANKTGSRKVSLCDGGGLEIPAGGVGVPPALSGWIASLLTRSTLKIRAHFEERLAPLGLKSKHFGILTLLESGPLSQVEIGRDMLVDRSTMVCLIDELVRRGLVERGPHPEDRRAHAVTLTTAGCKLLPEVTAIARAAENEGLSALSAAEQSQLRELLTRLL